MSNGNNLKGNIPVIPTPFVNGKIEYAGFDRLIERTVDYLDGYVVCGSTGEAPSMTTKERIDAVCYVAKKLPQSKEVVVGLGHTCLLDAVEIGLSAAGEGVRAALVPSPYYFPNSLEMVIDYVGSLAEKTGLDIVFYDNPVTTKDTWTTEELLAMAKAVPMIKAIKMTDHNLTKIRQLKGKSDLAVFGGEDLICFRAFEAGIDGNMIIAPILFPDAFRKCWDSFQNGDRETSFDIYCQFLLPIISMFGPGDEIPTTKALFQHLGIFSSKETRTPLQSADDRRIREVLLGYEQVQKAYSILA